MDQQVKELIFDALNNLRNELPHYDSRVFELIALAQGADKIKDIVNDKELTISLVNNSSLVIPDYLLEFIFKLIEYYNPNTIIDPWLSLNSPLIHRKLNKASSISFSTEYASLLKKVTINSELEILVGSPHKLLSQTLGVFEMIACFPPLGMREPLSGIEDFLKIYNLKYINDYGINLIFRSAHLLAEKGRSIFLVTPSFLNNPTVKENLKKLNLTVEAVFSIPTDAFYPYSSIRTNLVVLSKNLHRKTFVAELTGQKDFNEAILKNFIGKKEGKEIQLGSLTDFQEFSSLQNLISKRNFEQLTKRIGYPPICFKDIIIKIDTIKTDTQDQVVSSPNSIYLPKAGNSEVVTSPSLMTIKPKNYYQIQLDSNKANASFVANFFNNPIGRELRESIKKHLTGISTIQREQILTATIHLPDIATQLDLVQVNDKIDHLSLHLEELKRTLWKQPRSYRSIEKALKTLNQEEELEHWIDNLPFPISSILWRYYATQNNSKKIEHLFHFFEALSEFFAMVMLSAMVQDHSFYAKEKHNWISNDVKFKDWYLRATFGNWNNLTANLSKATRSYLNDKDLKDQCQKLYGYPSESFFRMVTSKGIINILFEAANLRNQWKGHGGITSEEENKQRILKLEQLLSELRKLIADGFEEVTIVKPKAGELESGIWTFNAVMLNGAKSPFREIEIRSISGLEKNKIYLTHQNQVRPIELLPFIKYNEASEAVYFYSSIESGNVRWVSYHFDKNPELMQPIDSELNKAIEFLKL